MKLLRFHDQNGQNITSSAKSPGRISIRQNKIMAVMGENITKAFDIPIYFPWVTTYKSC
jgi:hypothetical protein